MLVTPNQSTRCNNRKTCIFISLQILISHPFLKDQKETNASMLLNLKLKISMIAQEESGVQYAFKNSDLGITSVKTDNEKFQLCDLKCKNLSPLGK